MASSGFFILGFLSVIPDSGYIAYQEPIFCEIQVLGCKHEPIRIRRAGWGYTPNSLTKWGHLYFNQVHITQISQHKLWSMDPLPKADNFKSDRILLINLWHNLYGLNVNQWNKYRLKHQCSVKHIANTCHLVLISVLNIYNIKWCLNMDMWH